MTQRLRIIRAIFAFLFLAMFVTGMLGPVLAHAKEPKAPHVLVMTVDGIINPVKTRFISRAIDKAQQDNAAVLIIRLDTPGGLLGATRGIVGLLLESPVPVAVFVSPKGARAGSAGAFITAAGNFAVMAPGSNIGAASPISSTGEDMGETLASKVENDAAALIRSIAQIRGRNQDKLEQTVRTAASYSAQEAVVDNVVDLMADDVNDLLTKIDSQTAETSSGSVVLETEGLRIRPFEKNILEHFLEFISDPNVSFILLTVGGLGIVIELFNPGLIVPAVVGVICLLLAFLAVGNLPVNWAGVIFILLAAALAGFEVAVSGFGILGLGAVVSLVLGGLLLFAQFGDPSPTLPPVSVNRWLVGGTGAVSVLALVYFVRTTVQSRRAGLPAAASLIVGRIGTVTDTLHPRGVVRVTNETWTAVSQDGNVIQIGERILVNDVQGLVLTVSRSEQSDSSNDP